VDAKLVLLMQFKSIKNFPDAVTLDQLLIINKAPFEGDTLISLEELNFKMSMNFFKAKSETIDIQGISSNGLINILSMKALETMTLP
jgi:hypothetical protein